MQFGIPIVKDVHWVGMNDRNTALFEAIWPIPRGVSYNSYLVADQKVALVDTVKDVSLRGYVRKLKYLLGDRQIDYLIINHMEPDHSGAIAVIKQLYPGMKIIGNKKTAEFVSDLYDITKDVQVVQDGEELDLGRRKMHFYLTPMVHWPETMMTYDSTDGILYSGDAFGGFGTLEGGIFDDQVDIQYFSDEILRYFSNIVGKYSPMVTKAIDKLGGVSIKVIAPTHGPIWRHNPGHIVDLYSRWSRHEAETGVVVAFASMYGNAERMAEAVARGLADSGVRVIRVHNVSTTHVSYIIRDIWRFKGLVLGSPTYDSGVFPHMDTLLSLLASKRIDHRPVGLFGTYGWSGGAVTTLKKWVETHKFELLEPVIEAKFAADIDQLEECHELGRQMARRLKTA